MSDNPQVDPDSPPEVSQPATQPVSVQRLYLPLGILGICLSTAIAGTAMVMTELNSTRRANEKNTEAMLAATEQLSAANNQLRKDFTADLDKFQVQFGHRLDLITLTLNDRWTKTQAEAWAYRLKVLNPTIILPEERDR